MDVENLSSYTAFFVSAQFALALEYPRTPKEDTHEGEAEALNDPMALFMKELTSRSIEIWVLLWSLPLNMCVTMCN